MWEGGNGVDGAPRRVRAVLAGAFIALVLGGCATSTSGSTTAAPSVSAATSLPSAPVTAATTTTPPCGLTALPGGTVSVNRVCPSTGAPHFSTPEDAMAYLAAAWNSDDVREVDYVTDPAGRAQLNSMAPFMVNLQLKSCTENSAGDYSCDFSHDITPSPTTAAPNPMGYPPGEAVFTVGPAEGPGWYLTAVEHCD